MNRYSSGIPWVPNNESFNGVLGLESMEINEFKWIVHESDNPKVQPGMVCSGLASRYLAIFKGRKKGFNFRKNQNDGRLEIVGSFCTRELYGRQMTVPA